MKFVQYVQCKVLETLRKLIWEVNIKIPKYDRYVDRGRDYSRMSSKIEMEKISLTNLPRTKWIKGKDHIWYNKTLNWKDYAL